VANEKPNILWFCTDQQRFDTIHSLGNHLIRTPNTDRLIKHGTCFTQAYAQSPVCTPSRASFLTGRYARTTRCRQNGQQIPSYERLLSRLFADQGYVCGLAGKLHLSSCAAGRVESRIDDGYSVFHWSHHPQPDWPENGYTQWLSQHGKTWDQLYHSGKGTPYVKEGVPAEFHQTTYCAEKTIEFIREQQNQNWFFSFNCFDPHHPFDPPAEYFEKYDVDSMPLPKIQPGELDNKPRYQKLDSKWAHNEPGYFDVQAMTDRDRREVTAAYYAMVELIDDQLGRIIKALEETNQLENTLIIFMSDHGEMLGDHGLYLKGPHFYDESVRVPLVLHWPKGIKAGVQCTALFELLDLAPTLCDLSGIPQYEGFQGRSAAKICQGNADPTSHRDHVFSEYCNAWTHHHAYGSMLRTETDKIVVYHGTEDGELYDLEKDPDEFENLWKNPNQQDRKLELLRYCFDTSVFTMDPLPPRIGPF
jgi:arylsulfatase